MRTLPIIVLLSLALAACASQPKKVQTAPPAADPAPPAATAEPTAADVHIEGDHVVFGGHIYFEHDSDVIKADSHPLVDAIASLLKEHGEVEKVHVLGHTSVQGAAEHNLDLSNRRAAAVVAYLTEHGVVQAIDAKGMGLTQPLCKEDNDECHDRNRRVEFIIEKKAQ